MSSPDGNLDLAKAFLHQRQVPRGVVDKSLTQIAL
jgi:hypothetical protein